MKRWLLLLAALAPALAGASISQKVIDDVVREHADAFQDCYQEGLDRRPKLKGKITVVFAVEKDGTVSDAKAKSATLKDEKVETCILDEFRTMQFPDLSGGCDEDRDDCTVRITYPLTFSP